MAKFNSSRSKTARNPGPVGRIKTFNSKSSFNGKSRPQSGGFRGKTAAKGGSGSDSDSGFESRTDFRSRSNSDSRSGSGFHSGSDSRSGAAAGRSRRPFRDEDRDDGFSARKPRRSVDPMNFAEAEDWVRPEVPNRGGWNMNVGKGGRNAKFGRGENLGRVSGKGAAKKHFNPLNFLRADEEDGVVSIPEPQFVEMNDDDFHRLHDGERAERAERGEREPQATYGARREASPFRKSIRGTRTAGKFTKDFKAASEQRKTSDRPRKSFSRKSRPVQVSDQAGERLQKVLASAGFGSRRDCEEFIVSGRVTVDHETVTELGTRVMPEQTIHLDGELVRRPKKFVYFALNKPDNVICTNDDPDGRRRALDYISEKAPGLFPVGRLDLHSEGLLLVTNDGELANRLTHPSYEVPKVYRVRVSGTPTREEISQICRGVYLAEGFAKAEEVKLCHEYRDGTAVLEITLREGRNREIRRILARIGHNVLDLTRVSVGDVKLGKIPLGAYRPLTSAEVHSLRRLVGLETENPGKKPFVEGKKERKKQQEFSETQTLESTSESVLRENKNERNTSSRNPDSNPENDVPQDSVPIQEEPLNGTFDWNTGEIRES